jgi:hypothetical protein
VNKRLIIGIAAAALAATVSLAAAGPYRHPRHERDLLSPDRIFATVRALGFNPTTQPIRRGPYYVLHAFDPYGIEVRVVADAELGDILSVTDVVGPRYDFGPRIIHVPADGKSSSFGNHGLFALPRIVDRLPAPSPASSPANPTPKPHSQD